jgi:hypothetical protein
VFHNCALIGSHVDNQPRCYVDQGVLTCYYKILSFLRRNLQIKQEETKSLAYKSMVRSNLEYCSSIWAPHTKQHIDKIESVQRNAARYVTKRYHNTSSVTSMLSNVIDVCVP